jgi:hypothetical protein
LLLSISYSFSVSFYFAAFLNQPMTACRLVHTCRHLLNNLQQVVSIADCIFAFLVAYLRKHTLGGFAENGEDIAAHAVSARAQDEGCSGRGKTTQGVGRGSPTQRV